jgi:PAS domain S-box-containing protein
MKVSSEIRRRVFWNAAIIIATAIAIYASIFSIMSGIYAVFPFLYFMPIILFVYFYPEKGIVFTLGLSSTYLLMVYFFTGFNQELVAVSTAWFVIFVTIGVVLSSFAAGLKEEERKYQEIFENSQAGIFTFDLESLTLQEINEKCAGMLNYNRSNLIGKALGNIMIDSIHLDRFIHRIQDNPTNEDIELLFKTSDGSVRQFLVSTSVSPDKTVICSIIDITEKRLAEHVIQKAWDDLELRVTERTAELEKQKDELCAEIQDRKKFEAAIQLANRKLNTLSSITRHDILNQTTAVIMYLSLADEMSKDPDQKKYLKKIEEITHLIQKQIRFTRDYQAIGSSAPTWQDIGATISSLIKDLLLDGIRVETKIEKTEVFADLLLEKAFYNLFENSITHGEKVSTIRIFFQESPQGLNLIFEDDGIGIPYSAKEKIFHREYYRNTGYGLYLIQEILSITGISIRETGEPEQGARFELIIPDGSYRRPSNPGKNFSPVG